MKTNNLKILIVEDELLIAEMLKETLADLNYVVLDVAKNYEQAFLSLNKFPDINFIFLDINLSEDKTGFDIAQNINDNYNIPFIFLTSYSDKKTIQEAIAFKPEGYLIKPFIKSDLFIILEVYKSKNNLSERSIEIKEGHFLVKILHKDIILVKSENIYLEIKTIQRSYLIRNSLDKFLEQLNDNDFIKIHRSYVVNTKRIKAINRVQLIVESDKIPISRIHHDELVKRFLE
jgi:two-component system, LytTR family, response regulator LytT